MTARSADLEAQMIGALDRAISVREDHETRRAAVYAENLSLVEDFATRAANALGLAAATINSRAGRLGLDTPANVAKRIDQRVIRTVAASVTVSTSRPATNRDAFGRQSEPRRYGWTISVWLHIDASGRATRPEFEIEAHRDGWSDWWDCDIPTAECDPAGLSLSTPGEEVARRFMAWFTRYVA